MTPAPCFLSPVQMVIKRRKCPFFAVEKVFSATKKNYKIWNRIGFVVITRKTRLKLIPNF